MTWLGTDTEELVDTLSFFDNWEDKYRYIIDLGKQLPEQPESFRQEEKLVRGCQSQVWMDAQFDGNALHFNVDSDAHIVRGLLAMVMVAYQDKSPAEILEFDIEEYFNKLDLIRHLSPTRGNGIRSMVARIRQHAEVV